MSERERRIQRIAVGFAVVAVGVSVLAVVVTRHPAPRRDARTAPALERSEPDGGLAAAPLLDPLLDPLIPTVARRGATTYEMPRSTFEAWLASATRIMADGVAVFTAGRDGLEVIAIWPDSVFDALGIKNGDLVRAINGVGLESADQVIELIAKSTRRITVDVKRGDQMIILNYLIN